MLPIKIYGRRGLNYFFVRLIETVQQHREASGCKAYLKYMNIAILNTLILLIVVAPHFSTCHAWQPQVPRMAAPRATAIHCSCSCEFMYFIHNVLISFHRIFTIEYLMHYINQGYETIEEI